MKMCIKCNIEKSLNLFWNKKGEKDGKHRYCIECQKIEGKQYYSVNKEEHNARSNKWIKENKEKHAKMISDHYHNNKDYFREWNQNKMETDPLFRLRHSINALINHQDRKSVV
jgi:hypothetical protein